jgi:hypothetical protein
MTSPPTWHDVIPVSVVALTLLGIGCTGVDEERRDATAPPPAKTSVAAAPAVDACALLTRAEAEAALGMPVGDPVRGDVPPMYSCSYVTANRLNNISVGATSYSDTRQAYDSYAMAVKINGYEEFEGLGDRAYKSPVSDVTVLKGRYELKVDVTLSIPKEEQVKKAREIAATALARLPQ